MVGEGLLQVRGRGALRRDQEVRAEDRRQGRAVAVRRPGHEREVGGRARCRHRAGHRLFRHLRRADRRQVGVRRQARGPHGRPHADEGPLRGGRALDRQPLQRQGQEEGLLRLPDQAADAPYPVLEGHAGPGRLQGKRHSRHLEGILVLLVRQGAARHPQGDRPAPVRHRLPDGRGVRPTPSSRS